MSGCFLGRYDASFCRRSGKAGEGESLLSKGGAVFDRAEATSSAPLGEISNKSKPYLSIEKAEFRFFMQSYAVLCIFMQSSIIILIRKIP